MCGGILGLVCSWDWPKDVKKFIFDEETAEIAADVATVVRDDAFQLIFAEIDRNNDRIVTPIEFYNYTVKLYECFINPEPHIRAVRQFLSGF